MSKTASVNWPRLANEQSPKHRVGASNMPLSELQAAKLRLAVIAQNSFGSGLLRAFLDVAIYFSEKIPLIACVISQVPRDFVDKFL